MGILHDIGQLAGHALNAAPGYSTLGANITNPNINYQGVQNPGTPANNYFGAPWPGTTQPLPKAQNNPAGTVLGTNTLNSPAGPTQPAADPNQSLIDLINGSINRLPTELDIAKGNIQSQFNTNNNQLDSGELQAQNSYNTSTGQNTQQFVTNKDQINDQASGGLRSLLRVLGQHGAGGSSAALYAAPDAVGTLATQQRSGAGQTYGQNQQGLDTNFNNYQTGYGDSKKQLNDWLTQQNNSAQSTSDQAKQGLLQQLAGLQPTVAAAQPYIDQINGLAGQVDQLGKLNPTYTGTTPTYTAPDVKSYTVNQTGAPVLGGGGNGTSGGSISPALSFILGQQKDKNALTPNFA